MPKKPHVLVSPLNWGIGHATRCIPIIDICLDNDMQVTVASDGDALQLLKNHYQRDEVDFLELPELEVTYPSGDNVGSIRSHWSGVLQSSKFKAHIRKDHAALDMWLETNVVDLIISDNRYGVYSPQHKSILMTHQLTVKSPFQSLINKQLDQWFSRFDEIWIPDNEGKPNLTGEIGHRPLRVKKRYPGIMSRSSFEKSDRTDLTIIISGPSPQRERMLEKVLEFESGSHNYKNLNLIYQGKPDRKTAPYTVYEFPSQEQINTLLNSSKLVIARSGYTTVMDLIATHTPGILIPTPGQPEQLYLAESLKQKGFFETMPQNRFTVERCLKMENIPTPPTFRKNNSLILSSILENIHV